MKLNCSFLCVCVETNMEQKAREIIKQYQTIPENNLFNLPGKVLLCFLLLCVSYNVRLERIIQFCSLLEAHTEKNQKKLILINLLRKRENLLRQFSSSNLIEFSDKLSFSCVSVFFLLSFHCTPCQDMKSLGLIQLGSLGIKTTSQFLFDVSREIG